MNIGPYATLNAAKQALPGYCLFCLIRHGETDWNAARKLQGHSNTSLNAKGRIQAAAIAQKLAPETFDSLYSSDMRRALQTADSIAHTTGLAIHSTNQLRERHYGIFQGLTHAEAAEHYPEEFACHTQRNPDYQPPSNGESLNHLAHRLNIWFQSIAQQHRNQTVLIITHGGVLDILYRFTTGMGLSEPRHFALPNAALNWIACNGSHWQMLAWADSRQDQARDEVTR